MTYFVFNGKSNKEFGLEVAAGKVHSAASPEVERIAVPGRDGDLLVSKNRLNAVEKSFPVNLVNETGLIATNISAISEWLGVLGYHDLTISYDPEFVYRASYLETFSVEETLRQFGKTNITFLCHPIKYYKDGLAKVNLTNGQTLRGKGNVSAKPVIEIRGNGTTTLVINGRKTKLKDIPGTITLDMAANQVYSGNLPAWDKMVRAPEYQKPFLDVGSNKISWDGNFQVSIIPNWGVKI